MATPAALIGPVVDKLVLAPARFHSGVDLTDARARVVSDRGLFRRLLSRSRPVLVVIFAPPATKQDLEAVVRERRRRKEMRAVLVDEPTSISERLEALRSGFDEAIGADIDGRELLGRLALLADHARGLRAARPIEISAELALDTAARELLVRGHRVHLRPRECGLLEVLARRPGRTFSRRELLEAVGVGSPRRDMRTIDVHIRWLREKLDCDGGMSARLVTVRGVGYRLELMPGASTTPAAALTRR